MVPTPSPGRFRQADAILDAAIDLEPAEREAFVDRACEGNPSLRTLVRRLLRAFEQSGQFLSGPAVELAGPLLERPLDGLEDPADPVPPPERVGPYRVTRELGRGGMGVVYLAAREDDPAAPVVALKTLRGGALAVGTVLRRFLAERRILATLEHPYVAPLLESGITADGVPYFAMAHCEGGSLAERLDHGALPEPEAVRVALQLCEALAAAHGHGIVHRDIKPANVLFNAVGEVQLTDFGIAKLVDQDSTQSGAMMGTPAYLAPEQIRGETVDHRADLWAVGVSIYQMLTGRRPFDGPSYATILNQILTQDPETLTGRASVPPALAALVHHLLQKAPDARPHSADDVVAALAMIAGDPGASYVPAPARPRELPAAAASGVAGTSIVVMPFRNLSGSQDDAPFTDGLTEELITALGKVRGLRVTARATAFALGARQLDVRAVANLIGVAYLLEGSVRRGGDRLKVTAQLVQTDRGEVVWSETYNRPVGEIFAVEEELGGAIVAALEPALGPSAMSREPPRLRDVATYETYLKGRYFWQKRVTPDLVRAAEYFAQAAAADPTYAEAYAGIADAHMVLVMLCGKDPKAHLPKAREAVAEALRLGSGVPLVHATNGHLLSGFDWRWEEAEAELRRAIELNPGIIDARVYLSTMLQHLGRFEEAIAVAHEGLARDPLSPP